MFKPNYLKAMITLRNGNVHHLLSICIAYNVDCKVKITPIIALCLWPAHMNLDTIVFFLVKYVVINLILTPRPSKLVALRLSVEINDVPGDGHGSLIFFAPLAHISDVVAQIETHIVVRVQTVEGECTELGQGSQVVEVQVCEELALINGFQICWEGSVCQTYTIRLI